MMQRLGLYLTCFITTVLATYAQGFDWQYSARVPFESPVRFYGLELSTGYATHFASLDYLEQGANFTCCTYERGTGIPYGFMLAGDYWLTSNVSVQGGLGLAFRNVTFTSDPQNYPKIIDNTIRIVSSEYVFKGSLTYATLQAGMRYRLFGTHLNVGGGLKLLLKMSETQTQIDRVLGPDDYFFDGNPPSKEKDLDATVLNDASTFVIEPFATLSYDLAILRGTYLTPTLSIGGPITSLSKTQPWRSLDLGFSLRILTAF